MKVLKIVLPIVFGVLLVVSVVLNIIILCHVNDSSSIVRQDTAMTQSRPTGITYPTNLSRNETTTTTFEQPKFETTTTATATTTTVVNDAFDNKNTFTAETAGIIYEDANICITYVQSEKKSHGYEHFFNIENLSTKTLNVSFTNLCVNNRSIYVSGLTCEKLLPGTERIEALVIDEKDWESYPENPDYISFNIKLTNAKSYLDLYETEQIEFKV